MSGRRWLLRAFPRSWRARFGDQLGRLLDDIEEESGKIRAGDQLDVARAGLAERFREFGRHRQALLTCGVILSVAAAAAFSAIEFAGAPASQNVNPPSQASSMSHPETSRPTTSGHTTLIQTAQKDAAAGAAAQQAATRAQAAVQAAEAAQAAQTARAQGAAEAAAQSPSQAVAVSGTTQ
jgi:hypothetical protein